MPFDVAGFENSRGGIAAQNFPLDAIPNVANGRQSFHDAFSKKFGLQRTQLSPFSKTKIVAPSAIGALEPEEDVLI
jgi:hypothetical protein